MYQYETEINVFTAALRHRCQCLTGDLLREREAWKHQKPSPSAPSSSYSSAAVEQLAVLAVYAAPAAVVVEA